MTQLRDEREIEALVLARDDANLVDQAISYTESGLPLPVPLLEYLLTRPTPRTMTQRYMFSFFRDAFMALELQVQRNIRQKGTSPLNVVAGLFDMDERTVLRAFERHKLLVERFEKQGRLTALPPLEEIKSNLLELGPIFDDLFETALSEAADLLEDLDDRQPR